MAITECHVYCNYVLILCSQIADNDRVPDIGEELPGDPRQTGRNLQRPLQTPTRCN